MSRSRRRESNATASVDAAREAAAAPAPAPVAGVLAPPAAASSAAEPGSIDDLRQRLVELQTTVEQLVSTTQTQQDLLTGDPEVDSAARTLRFAQQTADAVIAEARDEALAIVSDAERQRSEIIRRARQQADQDYSAERDRVETSSAAWQAQRDEALDQLDALTAVFAQYREGLAHLDTTVTSIAERLRSGTIAEAIVVGGQEEPAAEPEPSAMNGSAAVVAAPADAASSAPDTAVPEPAIDLTDGATAPAAGEVADSPVRNPFAPPPVAQGAQVAQVTEVEADADPFVFDVAELPETTGDFGWETDEPGKADGATTF